MARTHLSPALDDARRLANLERQVQALLTGKGASVLDYVEIHNPVTVSATSEAAPVDVIVGTSQTYDGSTVKIEFFTPYFLVGAGGVLSANLWDDTTNLGLWGESATSDTYAPTKLERYLTPTAGTHKFSVRAWRLAADGAIGAGNGGAAATYMPAFLRVTRA